MLFLLYSGITATSIGENLGVPEYSYYFVLKGFERALSALGAVVVVQDPLAEVDVIYVEQQRLGNPCVFLSFTPPHKTPLLLRCPTVCVFAWEFSSIPNESWDGEPRHDWVAVLKQLAGAITLSSHTQRVVQGAMGKSYPVFSIPVPVYGEICGDETSGSARDLWLGARKLSVSCTVIDSKFYEIDDTTFSIDIPPTNFRSFECDEDRIELGFKLGDEGSGLMGGFYEPEIWGAWSKISAPWILLPVAVQGYVKLVLEYSAYGPNVGKSASLTIGGRSAALPMSSDIVKHEIEFNLESPANLIQFSGLNTSGLPNAPDPRSMGIGLRSLQLQSPIITIRETTSLAAIDLELDGVVYASVFNPGDDRKNWFEMLTGFCFAFRDEPRATLLLKMTHRSISTFFGRFNYFLERIGPIKCRVLILHGYFEDSMYRRLFDVSTYYVNTSNGEGLCLPLMEFMSVGVPAISPKHTAMSDYISETNAFVVEGSLEPFVWRHDPRDLLRTLRYRLNWESLVDAYRESFRIATNSPEKYCAMSKEAISTLFQFCSFDVVRQRLIKFLSEMELDNGELTSTSLTEREI